MYGEKAEEERLDMVENEESEVTEYEKERLERIKRNRDMLANLQVPDLEPVPKKPRGQSSKGTEKVSIVYPRRTTRLSTRTKTPTKIVDWSSGESDSESVPQSNSEGSAKNNRKNRRKKKASSADEELSDDEVVKKKEDDDEYEPSGASGSDQDEGGPDEPEDHETLQLSEKTQRGRNGRSSGKKAVSGKNTFRLKPFKSLSSPTQSSKGATTDEDGDDPDLVQAIMLSMKQDKSNEDLNLKSPGEKSDRGPKQRKRKRGRDLKFTESEVDAYFVKIAGKDMGAISVQLLQNAAIAHDFIWSEEELQDMIDVFDENDDGFLCLPEFRAMASRCKLMETT